LRPRAPRRARRPARMADGQVAAGEGGPLRALHRLGDRPHCSRAPRGARPDYRSLVILVRHPSAVRMPPGSGRPTEPARRLGRRGRRRGPFMFDFHEDLWEALWLAFRDRGRGESFWGSLLVYSALSAVIALIVFVLWRVL